MSRNDYDLPKITGTLAMTKLRNALLRIEPTLVVALKNIRVNGQLRGCSGFITNTTTGKIAYVNTEIVNSGRREALYRTATTTTDYSGGQNRFASHDEIAQKIVDLVA